MNRFTKITSSIGPNSESPEMLAKMIDAGVNVCRLNFSHDTDEAQGKKIDAIRKISRDTGRPIAIIADLQGPKHRIGNFKTEDVYPLQAGNKFILDNDPTPGDATRVQLPDLDVIKSINVGDRVLLNDGKIELKVEKISGTKIETTVVRGTEIWSRRGFNLPDTEIKTSVLTSKDRHDLEYALTKNPDFVAISFVQSAADVIETREFITERTAHPVKIIVKVERPQAIERLEEIVDATDGIMIARGDLAVELPFERVPAISRQIIRDCRRKNKPVIMATQMLGSMVHNEFPLRAEISDIASASYLRVDSTMTSEETTIGDHPVTVVETMAKILKYADEDALANAAEWSRTENLPENDWSRSIASIAYLNKASAIVVFARDTVSATQISCRRPDLPIIAVCNEEVIANQLCLSRGVFPICDTQLYGQRDAFNAARAFQINRGKLVIVDEDKISLRTLD